MQSTKCAPSGTLDKFLLLERLSWPGLDKESDGVDTKPFNDARQPLSCDVIYHRFPVSHMVY